MPYGPKANGMPGASIADMFNILAQYGGPQNYQPGAAPLAGMGYDPAVLMNGAAARAAQPLFAAPPGTVPAGPQLGDLIRAMQSQRNFARAEWQPFMASIMENAPR